MTYWSGARTYSPLLALGVLLGAAHAQNDDQAKVPAPSGQAVTLAEVEGGKIHAKLVTEMLVQRQGRQFPLTQDFDWQIEVQIEQKINFTAAATAHTPRGIRMGPVRGATVKLGEPWRIDNGEAVWSFKDGELTFVRSHQGGAVRTIISLTRNEQNLTCTAAMVFAREQGKNGLLLNSAIDGAPVSILSWKPVSSTCDVAGKKLDAANPKP